MLEALLAVAVTAVVLALLIPLGLVYLLARQVVPVRPMRTVLLVLICTFAWPQSPLLGLVAGLLLATLLQHRWLRRRRNREPFKVAITPGLGRQWASLLRDAGAARDRFTSTVAAMPAGPLRDRLWHARAEVDQAVAEAQQLAERGSRTERAQRDVLTALDAQRRRGRRGPALSPDLEHSLQAATRAQHQSAERLGAAARRDLCQLQLVVARLHELTAHALELATATHMAELPAPCSIGDQLAALRMATAEVEEAARV